MGQDSPIKIAADRYQIEGEIGRGGMGVVLKAHDRVLNILVAIKVLGNDPTGMGAARLQREATAAGKLSHQNIARIFDFGQTTDSTPYMVMEYLEGQSLSDLIKQESRLDCRKAVPIFIQIASALCYAHSSGVIHRDLKPSNVMLIDPQSPSCQSKLLDFGVASIFNEDLGLTRTGAIIGSPHYMSPEQSQGETVTNSSDIYSFGCLMFETLTGQVPFQGASALETISMHRNTAPPLVTDLISVQKLPNELVTLIDECLRKIPQNRPADFEIILQRLKAIEDKLENRVLTLEQVQKISNQHFKIRIHQFWKSNFGGIALVASLVVLTCLGLSISQSENKKVVETKLTPSAEPSDSSVPAVLAVDFGVEPLKYSQDSDGKHLLTNDTSTDEALKKAKEEKIFQAVLDHGSYDGSGLKYLNPKYLKRLIIANVRFKENNIQYLDSLQNLQLLSINSDSLTDQDLEHIAKLNSLRELRLHSNNLTAKGIEKLANLPDLDYLVIESTGIKDDIVGALFKMKNLKKLYLVKTSLSPDFITKITSLNRLDELSLEDTREISDKSFNSLPKLKKLTGLKLAGIKLNEHALQCVGRTNSILLLLLEDAKFNPSDIKHLRNMPRLFHLSLKENKNISDELIEEIVQLKPLCELNLSDTNINDTQFLKLTKLRNLNSISIFGTKISPETLKTFRESHMLIRKKETKIFADSKNDDMGM
jgi:serine/threonine-protein kinase